MQSKTYSSLLGRAIITTHFPMTSSFHCGIHTATQGRFLIIEHMDFETDKTRNGWGATAVESLGTAAIMDIPEIVDQIMEFIPTIDFQTTKAPVDLFETTIRYLGGMLSAYDLLTGPMRHLNHEVRPQLRAARSSR
jgi:hypothetical protein